MIVCKEGDDMEILKERKDDVLVVQPIGRLDSTTSEDFSQFIGENFTTDTAKLVLDFQSVDFISSKGLRVLVSVYKELGGRQMEIVNANSSVHEILRISGLLKVFGLK